tara:strand:- start:775 stop:1734 length:960 start_codon:yes stop_codon:yes gene_type:complete
MEIEKINLKVIMSAFRMKMDISKDFHDLLNKENKYYNFVSIRDDPDFIFSHEFKIWTKLCTKILTSNEDILTNAIIFDRFKFDHIEGRQSLRRLYLGTLSQKNTLKLPKIEGRAQKLIDEKYILFSKKFKIKKDGVIVVAPNRHQWGWYFKNKGTLSNLEQIERTIKIIKENSPLDIELRIHPKTNIDSKLKNIMEKYNVKLNNDTIDELVERAYCVIGDRSTIGPHLYLRGCLLFNFQEDYEHTIVSTICLRDYKLLDPKNLKDEDIPSEETRFEYLELIATLSFSNEEINNGYFLEYIYPILLENKEKFHKLYNKIH